MWMLYVYVGGVLFFLGLFIGLDAETAPINVGASLMWPLALPIAVVMKVLGSSRKRVS